MALPLHLYNAARCKSITYFTALNPSFGKSGGFFGDYKSEIHKYIPTSYGLIESIVDNVDDIKKAMELHHLKYPIVLKPDAGERGEGVKIINSIEDAISYMNMDRKYPTVLQEFADFSNEFGIFIYNEPNKGWHVSGVNTKKAFEVEGDGVSNLLELVSAKCRYRQQLERLEKSKCFNPELILKKGEIKRVDNIQNHRYGAEFINCSDLINDRFSSVIIGICAQIPGFNYGRFDIKANNFNDIENHKFKVIELNGAAAEPTIIFDQKNTGLWKSLKIIFQHTGVQGRIARNNINEGHVPLSFKSFRTVMSSHLNI
jgi:hypothetical protein